MLASATDICGTIGGGRLEWMAVAAAREMLGAGEDTRTLDIPLGPEIGQCCGGRVRLSLSRGVDGVAAQTAREWAARPVVLVLGAGHVGRAVADLLQHLPYRTRLIDPRPDELSLSRADVERVATPLPEAEVAAAPVGAAYIVLTHDHGLDFLLTSAALSRGDAGYVGLIGSATKRARFVRAHDGPVTGLTCPIGGAGGDKRPAIIAALVVAEVVRALSLAS